MLGHSYGGSVITHASVGLDVSRLVYLCSFLPDRREDPRLTRDGSALGEALASAIVAGDDGTLRVDPARGVAAFYHDCPDPEVRRAVDLLRPMSAPAVPVLEQDPPWASVPSTYVVCTDDRALPADLQRALAVRAGATVVWDVAHSPFLAKPELLVELLAGYAA